MKDEKIVEMDIEDCDPSTFSDFLHFLYYADTDSLSPKNIYSLHAVAKKYNVSDLIEYTGRYQIRTWPGLTPVNEVWPRPVYTYNVAPSFAGFEQVSNSSTLHQKTKILRDLEELFLNREHSDVILTVKGQEFPAHKAILIARSPVFSSMFRCDMKEKKTGEVDIKDCDPSTFSDFLHFLYCTDTDNLSLENVFSLYLVAEKYDVPDLKEACVEFLKKKLSLDAFVETVIFAIQWAETELINFCIIFFIRNRLAILAAAEWKTFVLRYPTECNEFLSNLQF